MCAGGRKCEDYHSGNQVFGSMLCKRPDEKFLVVKFEAKDLYRAKKKRKRKTNRENNT